MKLTTLILTAVMVLSAADCVRSAEYDAGKDFMCGDQASEYWSYSAYRVSDGVNRELAYGRVPLTEVSKYGADAFYLPDGGQELRPFFVRLGEDLFCSPAFSGPAYDASLVWTSPSDGSAALSGVVELVGKIGAKTESGGVRAALIVDGETVWTEEAGPDGAVEYSRSADVKKGSTVELRISNAAGDGPKVTRVNLHISVH